LKGTAWITIDLVVDDHVPACRQSHRPTERFFAKDGWFFIGAKGLHLFFEAADGTSGGMPFRILDLKTGKKVFEDSVWGRSHFEFVPAPDGKFKLRYQRLIEGDCSIPKDGMSCWSKFRSNYGLVLTTVPKCIGYRHEGDKVWAPGDEGVPPEEITTASFIAYPVEAELFPLASIRAIPGSVTCGPVE
jgi:hypothetical protein